MDLDSRSDLHLQIQISKFNYETRVQVLDPIFLNSYNKTSRKILEMHIKSSKYLSENHLQAETSEFEIIYFQIKSRKTESLKGNGRKQNS